MTQNRFYFKTKKSIIQQFSDSDIETAIKLYQQKKPTEQIVEKLNINTEAKRINFYKHLPYERSTNKCYCGDILYHKIASNSNKENIKFICFSCGHYEAPWCTCPECVIRKNKWREEGMKEFISFMEEHLFPKERIYDDPFEDA